MRGVDLWLSTMKTAGNRFGNTLGGYLVEQHVEKENDRRGPSPHRAQRNVDVTRRLARIEGQVRGVTRMVEEGRYCVDVLTQIAAVHQGLRRVARELLVGHMEHCVRDAMESADPEECRRVSQEVAELIFKYSR